MFSPITKNKDKLLFNQFEWEKKINDYKTHQERISRDQRYVNKLNEWEKTNLPDYKDSMENLIKND